MRQKIREQKIKKINTKHIKTKKTLLLWAFCLVITGITLVRVYSDTFFLQYANAAETSTNFNVDMSEINHGGGVTESGNFNVLSSLPVLVDEAAASNSFQEYTGFVGEYVSRPVRCESIVAVPSTINEGQQSQIQYQLRDADDATINQGIGAVAVPNGIVIVSPTETTTFTLVATRGTFDATCSVTITVNDNGQVLGDQDDNGGGNGVGGTGGGDGGNLGSGYYGGGGFYGGGDPEDPQNPTDPENPQQPETPTEPQEPSEPVDPQQPQAPADPVDPQVPVDPVEITIPGEVLTPAILRPTEVTPSPSDDGVDEDAELGTDVGNRGDLRERDNELRGVADEKDVMTYPLIDPPGFAALYCAPDQKPHYAYILWIVIVLLLIIVFYQRIEIKDLLNETQRKK